MKKITAIILALVFALGACLMLASCGGKTTDETTAATTEANEPETMAQAENPEASTAQNTADESVQPSEGASETAPAETTTLAAVEAPVGGSVAQIVEYYNKAANAAKAYPGTMKVKRTQGTVSSLESISIELARGIVEGILPNDYPQEKTVTFTNGKSSSGEKASAFFPVDDKPYTSNLTPAGVKSASCAKQGSGYKVVITLVSEKGDDINFVPKHHSSCADTLALTQEDLDPLTINECNITYTGATITATVDEYGRITTLNISEPVVIEGKVAWKSFNIIEVKVIGTWKQEFVVTY